MEFDGDYCTNRDWYFWYSNEMIIKGAGGLEGWRTSGDRPNYSTIVNQVVTRKLREKEACKYLGILKVDTIKQMEMKEKLKRSISEEPENYSRQNSLAGTLSKG